MILNQYSQIQFPTTMVTTFSPRAGLVSALSHELSSIHFAADLDTFVRLNLQTFFPKQDSSRSNTSS